jgi:2-polyprenyl-3-methyl-5-hydroxy-6-metoxy-1,4-benzoquinol methylase
MWKILRVTRKRWRAVTRPFRRAVFHLRRLSEVPNDTRRLVAEVAELRREVRLLYAAGALPQPEIWQGRPLAVPDAGPGVNVLPNSTCCRQEAFEQPWFSWWNEQFRTRLRYHRKLWEYVFICQALWERDVIRPGARGVGFGVGVEPLSSWFASRECQVLGTDMAAEVAETKGWSSSIQHSAGKAALRWHGICTDDQFDRNVGFRECDMNHIPDDLTGFDFCWSSCAFEHLGSIEKGLAFVERSLDCLKPGGWVVHTTELNLSSNDDTVDHQETVLFRQRDFEELARRLTAKGHRVAPLDFDPGYGPVDRYIDVPPYRDQPVLKLLLAGYSATSFGIIVQRGPDPA